MIKRDLLLEKIKDYKDKDIIKIITGIRRSGKSYLLFEIYYNYLIENGIDKQHIILIISVTIVYLQVHFILKTIFLEIIFQFFPLFES